MGGKSDLGIWLRLLIREEKSGNKLSPPSPPSTQWSNQQAEFRSLIQRNLPRLSASSSFFLLSLNPSYLLIKASIRIHHDVEYDYVVEEVEVNICSSSVS